MVEYKSQVEQDRFLNEKVFKNFRNGFFLDIGAFDGKTISNTFFFEKHLNWDGFCFEPMPEYFDKLKKNRKAQCINACIGTKNGIVKFNIINNCPMLSGIAGSISKEDEEKRRKSRVTQIKSNIIKFNDFIKDNAIKEVHYLTIDMEGGEDKLLNHIDFSKIFIHTISVEDNQNEKRVDIPLKKEGFILIKHASYDKIFINKRSPFYSKKLKIESIIANILNKYYKSWFEKYLRSILNVKKNHVLYRKLITVLTK